MHDAHRLLDVARVAADEERREIVDGADDGARLPFERRLAPAVEPSSSVSTLTKIQLRISALTTKVRMAVIFMCAIPMRPNGCTRNARGCSRAALP